MIINGKNTLRNSDNIYWPLNYIQNVLNVGVCTNIAITRECVWGCIFRVGLFAWKGVFNLAVLAALIKLAQVSHNTLTYKL